jgi:tRNA G10  N-methylase Trm11
MNKTHESLPEYAIVLGRAEHLSVREIEATLKRSGRRIDALTVTSGIALVKATPAPDATWFAALGGAVKFGVVIGEPCASEVDLHSLLVKAIGASPTIGLSIVGSKLNSGVLASGLKREIPTLRRFMTPTEGGLFSAAQSKGIVADKGSEWLILATKDSYQLIQIQANQDIDDMTRRDRDLPVSDAKRGMLPTKLARMMVNIALGERTTDEAPVLLDPFCGTGRTLIEALLVGAHILGADIDAVAVEASRQNLAWAANLYHRDNYDPEQLLTSPIDKIGRLFSPNSIDAIATEPFLGPPMNRQPTSVERDRLFDQLIPSYEALLRAGQLLLKPGGRLVAVFPMIQELSLRSRLVDSFPRFGYHLLDSIPVTRADQWIARDIVLLKKLVVA